MKASNLLAVALLATAPALAFAQSAGQGMTHEQFNHLDRDASGTVSAVEYQQFMEGAFKEMDADRNNSLSASETSRVLTAEQFAKMDVNGDGRVNRQEFLDRVMDDFHRHDSDQDGQLRP